SAVAFATGTALNPLRNSPAMVAAVVRAAAADETFTQPGGILREDRRRRFLLIGAVSVGVAALSILAAGDTMGAYARRNWLLHDAAYPSSATIVAEGFTDGRLRWPLGDDLTLTATAPHHVPKSLHAEIESAGGEALARGMDRRGQRQFVTDL